MFNSISYYQLIFFILSLIIGFSLSFWVYFAGKQKKINQLFSFMVLLWIIGEITPYFVFRNILLPPRIISFLPKLEIAFVFLFLIFFYFFAIYFLKESQKFRILNKIVPLFALPGTFLALFTSLFEKEIIFTPDGRGLDLTLSNEGKIVWLGFVIVMTLFIFSRFLVNYFRSGKENKLQLQYFLIGVSFWVVTSLVLVVYFPLIKNTFKYAALGNYSILFLFSFTAYAIVKQNLFGIRVVLTQFLVGVIAILLFVQILDSQAIFEYVWKSALLLTFLIFGYMLIKSVIREIKRREEIEKIDKAKSEFISIASHQLRTPLTAIKGYISMILEGSYGKLEEKAKRPMENVFQSNERLIRLVNDLLNLSRLDAGKIKFEPEPTSLAEMAKSIIEELKINVEKKGLYIKTEKSKTPLPEIMVDQDQLRQVVLNIIDNAIKYTKEGGITVTLAKLNSHEEIRIKDTGEGMEKEEIESLFQMFSRATAGTQLHTEGAGIGLYVAKQFVEMHGGQIWAESDGRGKGSAFVIRLPLKLDKKLLKTNSQSITEKPKHFI